ncbi:MAG: oxidoreductase [Gemmatales bacterium]|nr:MAG: oxidoreductase [Gemmatales bacterium]
MKKSPMNRRHFLQISGAAAAGVLVPSWYTLPASSAAQVKGANEKFIIGAIGVGSRGKGVAGQTRSFGDIVAIADVDLNHAGKANKDLAKEKAKVFQDYRKLLDIKEIDVVTVGTPDHWHTKICIDAMNAGKDVYCEKPLTLTIDEGKLLCQAVEKTKKVLQVGTQQRSEYRNMFLTAVAMAREGRLGKIKRVTCAIGGAPKGGPFKKTKPPMELDWNFWLGQCPVVDYIKERCHYQFRWWYEYSGGKMTDWGAHHVDIAQWAIGMEASGPESVEVISETHPVPLKDGYPTVDDQYNTATAFQVKCLFPNGVEMIIRHDTANGVTIEGEKGKIFVSRGKLQGEPVEELKKNPIPEKVLVALRKGKPLSNHMTNFFTCVKDRSLPVSDVFSHHRALSTCHLANIAIRLKRNLKWDPKAEQIVGDKEANAWLAREQRKGFEISL